MPSAPRRAILVTAALLLPLAGALPLPPPGAERWAIGLSDLGSVQPGDTLAGGRVLRVDAALRFAVVQGEADTAQRAASLAGVRYAVADPLLPLLSLIPDDPRWGSQYGPQHVGAPLAWETTRGATSVTVCFTDTGVRRTHEDLAGRYGGGYDFWNGDGDPGDDNGHGTHVTGIAAAATHNGKGVAGLAGTTYKAVKVLNFEGDGYLTDVASGIRWCADNGAHILSMSVGSDAGHSSLADAVAYAASRNVVQFAAAGNDGCDPCVDYPAAYPEVIAVGCTDASRLVCTYSSRGSQVELAAPGDQIWSASHQSDTGYASLSGSSMSVPHAAGAAALVKSVEPHLSAADLRTRLTTRAQDLGTAGRDRSYGFGLVRADLAVGNLPPTVSALACGPDPAATGRLVTCILTATDAPGGLFFTVDWGDGSAPERVPAAGTVAPGEAVLAAHRFGAPGTATVTVTATDTHPTPATSAPRIHLLTLQANAAPTAPVLSCSPTPAPAGRAGACTFRSLDDSDGVAYLVDWGDGSALERVPASGFARPGVNTTALHAWPAGEFVVSASAVDDGLPVRAGGTTLLSHRAAACAVERVGLVRAPGGGQMVEGITSASEDFPADCVGQVYDLAGLDALDDFDVCWYAGNTGLLCHRSAGNEVGVVPAGANRARVLLSSGDGGEYRLRLGLGVSPCAVDRTGFVPAPGAGVPRDGVSSRLESLPLLCGGQTYALTATVPTDNFDLCWLRGAAVLRCDRTAGGEVGWVPEEADQARILNVAGARGEFRLRIPAETNLPGATWTLGDDDGEQDAVLRLNALDDTAVKWIEVPEALLLDVASARLLVRGQALDCVGVDEAFALLVDNVPWTRFNPCVSFPTVSAGWASFSLPRELLRPGYHRFELVDTTAATRLNLELGMDTDTARGNTQAREDGAARPGELMWRLEVVRN